MIRVETKLLNKTNILGIAIFPFIITRPSPSKKTINHERIHIQQQLELLVIPFYILYIYYHIRYGYKNNPFEVEAFNYDTMDNYLSIRKRYNYFCVD